MLASSGHHLKAWLNARLNPAQMKLDSSYFIYLFVRTIVVYAYEFVDSVMLLKLHVLSDTYTWNTMNCI